MQNTENYNLKKPELSDHIHISDLNDNMDTLDDVIKDLSDNQAAHAAEDAINTTEILNTITSGESFVGYGYEPLGGVIRIDDNDPRIKYSEGDWKRGKPDPRREGLNSFVRTTTVIGATIEINFIGTSLIMGTSYDSGCGKFNVSVDNGAEIIFDMYSASPVYNTEIILASGLDFGQHTVKITVMENNPSANHNYIYLYYFNVITTSDSSIELAVDGVKGKSSAITEGIRTESLTDITHNIPEINQLIPNASFKRMSPTWGTVFQDDFNRANGTVGNGWSAGSISGNQLSLSADTFSNNGSEHWKDRKIRFSFTAPSYGLNINFKFFDENNAIYCWIVVGDTNNIIISEYVEGVSTDVNSGSFNITADTIYYVTAKSEGDLYSLSITSNSDYVTDTITVYAYIPFGKLNAKFRFYAHPNNTEPTLIDSVVVTAPVSFGFYPSNNVGSSWSITDNTVNITHNLAINGYAIDMGNGANTLLANVIAEQSYTFIIQKKLTSYTSGNGVRIAITWRDFNCNVISVSEGSFNTTTDSDFTTMILTAVAPADAVYAEIYTQENGILSCQWKEPLLELTETARGIFHKKESRCDLVYLDKDGNTDIFLGTGKDELGYRVEEDGIISKFYRDKDTIPYWDRVKVWTGGTGWFKDSDNGGRVYTKTAEDSYYISFVGTGIDLLMQVHNSDGIFGVSVDGEAEFFIDSYAPSASYKTINLIKGLSYGQHQIKLRCTGTTNLLGVAECMVIYAFDIYVPAIPETPANCQPLGAVIKADPDHGWIRYEEDEGVVYSGTWGSTSPIVWKYSNNLNDYAEFNFIGTGIRWIGPKNPIYGIAEIFTDEGLGYISRGIIDEYNSVEQVPVPVLFSKSDLPLQLNKIKIVNTHTKNASATDYYIGIDAFEVKQPLYVIDLRKSLQEDVIKFYIEEVIGDINQSDIKGNFPGTIIDYINLLKAEKDALQDIVDVHKAETVHVGVVRFATGSTSSPTTTSTGFVDMPDMSVTLTTKGGDLILLFNGGVSSNTSNGVVATVFTLDGSSINGSVRYPVSANAGNRFIASMLWRTTGLTAGSHTIKVQWAVNSGQTATSYLTNRNLLVMEVKAPCN